MKKLLFILLLCFAAYAAALAANPPRAHYLDTLKDQPTRSIWVSSNGWHTGIIVPMADISANMLPQKSTFTGEAYLEMGWGDAGFYQAEEITTSLAARALLVPSASAVHLVGFAPPPAHYFASSDVLRLSISVEGFTRLLHFMQASIAPRPSNAIYREKGLYGNSRFYEGAGEYSALHTCNHWAADALRAAGIPLTPWYAATSGTLMWQLRRYADTP